MVLSDNSLVSNSLPTSTCRARAALPTARRTTLRMNCPACRPPHQAQRPGHQAGELAEASVDLRVEQLLDVEGLGYLVFANLANLAATSPTSPTSAFPVSGPAGPPGLHAARCWPGSPRQPLLRGYPASPPDCLAMACNGWLGHPEWSRHILRPVLVVQERRRFYRESMTAFLRRHLGAGEVAAGVADADGVLAAAAQGAVDQAVIEADGVPWDVPTLVATLRSHQPRIRPGRPDGVRPSRVVRRDRGASP